MQTEQIARELVFRIERFLLKERVPTIIVMLLR